MYCWNGDAMRRLGGARIHVTSRVHVPFRGAHASSVRRQSGRFATHFANHRRRRQTVAHSLVRPIPRCGPLEPLPPSLTTLPGGFDGRDRESPERIGESPPASDRARSRFPNRRNRMSTVPGEAWPPRLLAILHQPPPAPGAPGLFHPFNRGIPRGTTGPRPMEYAYRIPPSDQPKPGSWPRHGVTIGVRTLIRGFLAAFSPPSRILASVLRHPYSVGEILLREASGT